MKKLFVIGALTLAITADAAQFSIQSFFNPGVSTIIVTNGLGFTNLNYKGEYVIDGLYQLATNNAGTGINVPIMTNYTGLSGLMYTDSIPVQWFGQVYPGTFTIITNQTAASTLSTNDVKYVTGTTNNQFNFFQDVNLPQDQYNALVTDNGQPGAAGSTNSIGYIQVQSLPFVIGTPSGNAGSNIVTLGFSPIAAIANPNPNGSPSTVNGNGYIPGYVADQEPNDTATSGGTSAVLWTVSYTNQISLVNMPTVVNFPVPRWKFPGCRGMRLRWIYPGSSTNAVAVTSVTYVNWTP